MKLVFVHGIAQGGKDPQLLKEEWLGTLRTELKSLAAPLPAGIAVEFPYYGDMLDEFVRTAGQPYDPAVVLKGPLPIGQQQFLREAVVDLAGAAGLSDAEISAELQRSEVEKGLQNQAWAIATCRLLDRWGNFSAFTIEKALAEVYTYQADSFAREAIIEVVDEAIGDGPAIVVGHSLGSVVSFDALREMDGRAEIPCFLTLGSPLGIRAVQKYLTKPLRMPGGVKRWCNARDPKDVVALNPLTGDRFAVTPEIENFNKVTNDSDNRHSISGYLKDSTVAQLIRSYF